MTETDDAPSTMRTPVPAISLASFWTPDHLPASGWLGHVPFAFWLIDALRPRRLVELGTHRGLSYLSFCQAISTSGAGTAAHAIDPWQSEERAGLPGETVHERIIRHNHRYREFSTLMRMTSSEGSTHFSDRTVDLLHVAGSPRYDDVRAAYGDWSPKLTDDAVVLFHDTNVREPDFGVWRVFDELSERHPSFLFLHGRGLGVLCPGSTVPDALSGLLAGSQDTVETTRRVYAALGGAVENLRLIEETKRAAVAARHAQEAAQTIALADRRSLDADLASLRRRLEETERAREAEAVIARRREAEAASARERQAVMDRERSAALLKLHREGAARRSAEATLSTLEAERRRSSAEAEMLRSGYRGQAAQLRARRDLLARWPALTGVDVDDPAAATASVTVWQNALRRLIRARQDLSTRLGRESAGRAEAEARLAAIETSAVWRLWRALCRALGRQPARAIAAGSPDADARLAQEVERTGLFDAEYYLAANEDVADSGIDPARHFAMTGWSEGRRANPEFDPAFYLERHADVAAQGVNPLVHYAEDGFLEGRQTSSIAASRPASLDAGDEALRHAIEATGLFDRDFYLAAYPDVAATGLDPALHFAQEGWKEGRRPNPFFDPTLYLSANPDVVATGQNPLLHYAEHGLLEGRHRSAGDGAPSEVEGSASDATLAEAVRATGLFDEAFYLRQNPDVAASGVDPALHYATQGWRRHRRPNATFDPAHYLERHPDVAALRMDPLVHYARHGREEERSTSREDERVTLRKYGRWVRRYDTLTEADSAAIARGGPHAAVHLVWLLDEIGVAGLDVSTIGAHRQIGVTARTTIVAPSAAWRERLTERLPDGDASGSPVVVARDDFAAIVTGADVVVLCFGPVLLRAHCGYTLAEALRGASASAAYSDHDHLTGEIRHSPAFKPAYSPEYLSQYDYIGPVLALKGPAFDAMDAGQRLAVGEARSAAAVIDALHLASVDRVPFVLYHVPADQTAEGMAYGGLSHPAVEAVVDACAGREDGLPSVDIIVPTRDMVAILKECVTSLLDITSYPADRFRIVIVDNGSRRAETLAYFDGLEPRGNVDIVKSPGVFNFSKICNDGARAGRGEVLVFLNNDTVVIDADWLRKLVAKAREVDVGVVGAMLLYPDDTIQHGGVVVGVQGVAAHRRVGDTIVPGQPVDVTRETSSVTGACMAIRRTAFWEVGGFDENLHVAFNDVAMCLTALEHGLRNIYVGDPLMYHHESKSRGLDDKPEKMARTLREATYVIERFRGVFRNDRSYNPNLSLDRIDDVATPPRVSRPWMEAKRRPKVLLLSVSYRRGYGVPVVIAQHAARLIADGFDVILGGPRDASDIVVAGARRVNLPTPQAAADFVFADNVDCVISHTPPFFSIARQLGTNVLVYVYDYGEPNPEFFDDRELREAINREKRMMASLADRVFCISQTIYNQQYRKDAIVSRLGNTHLDTWSPEWNRLRNHLRRKFEFGDEIVIINVCRFHAEERRYKGVDRFAEIAQEIVLLYPETASRCRFIIAGRGDEDDVRFLEGQGIQVFANPTDDEILELYAASDLYMNFSKWEGYNLGIGQALAMGLRVIASDIEAHREFPIRTVGTVMEACRTLAEMVAEPAERAPVVESWESSLTVLSGTLAGDLDGGSRSRRRSEQNGGAWIQPGRADAPAPGPVVADGSRRR